VEETGLGDGRQVSQPPSQVEPPRLDELPPEIAQQMVAFQAQFAQFAQLVQVPQVPSPLPRAEDLEAYERIPPGAAERIVTLAEQQSSHRLSLEAYTVRADSRRSVMGLVAGLVVSLAAFGVAGLAVVNRQPWVAGVVTVGDLAGLAGVFMLGTRGQRDERLERLKQLLTPATPRQDNPDPSGT
jgi:uncharacterized membrane protein